MAISEQQFYEWASEAIFAAAACLCDKPAGPVPCPIHDRQVWHTVLAAHGFCYAGRSSPGTQTYWFSIGRPGAEFGEFPDASETPLEFLQTSMVVSDICLHHKSLDLYVRCDTTPLYAYEFSSNNTESHLRAMQNMYNTIKTLHASNF